MAIANFFVSFNAVKRMRRSLKLYDNTLDISYVIRSILSNGSFYSIKPSYSKNQKVI